MMMSQEQHLKEEVEVQFHIDLEMKLDQGCNQENVKTGQAMTVFTLS